ncbi:MAG: OmpA family protein, partial [Flavobacterium sp.]
MKPFALFLITILVSHLISAQSSTKYSVFFNTAKSEITSVEKEKLVQFIKSIDSTKLFSISLNSYCDDRGSSEYNQKLSEQRTNSIKNFLLNAKLKSNSIVEEKSNGEIQ